MANALTAFAMKNFRSGSTYYDWSTISSSSKNFGCGYYNSGENWTVAVRVTVNDYIDRITCRFCMTVDDMDWGSENVTWNYKIFTSESALNAAANYSTGNKGDGTVTWDKGSGQTTIFNVWAALAAGTYYILFWRTTTKACEIRWCNYSGNNTYYSHMTATSAERYTVTYNANGGSGAPSSQQKIKGFTLTLSSTKPTRGNSSAGSYRVTFNANGGSCSTAYLDAARTTSYTFSKWNTNSSGTGTSYSSGGSYTANAAVTLYAVWSSSTSTSAITLPSASRDGYTFKGWSTSNSASSGSTGSYTPSGAVTLYATWSANTYTIKYNGNGNTGGSTANSSHTYGTAKALTANGFTRTGYTFSGWATSASGSKVYSDKQSVSNLTTTNGGTVNLYAVWSANTYTITVHPNGGTLKVTDSGIQSNTDGTATITVTYGRSYYSALGVTASRTGYQMNGFYDSTSGGTKLWNNGGECLKDGKYWNSSEYWCYAGNVDIYAVWSANNTYELTINPNGGTYKGSTGLSYVTNLSFDAYYEVNTPPTRTGYSFLGWKPSGSGNILSGTSTGTSSEITATAKTDTDGTCYTNYKFSASNSGTSINYYYITFFDYNFTAGHTYQLCYDIRVNSISDIGYFQFRHSAFDNNWQAPSKFESSAHGWQHNTLTNTFQVTTTQGDTTYTTHPQVNVFVSLDPGKAGTLDIDIKNIYVYDVSGSSYATSMANVKNGATFYIQGNTTIQAVWEANGLVYIDNGSSFDAYQVFIDNGTSWDQYIPYIDNETSWDILS